MGQTDAAYLHLIMSDGHETVLSQLSPVVFSWFFNTFLMIRFRFCRGVNFVPIGGFDRQIIEIQYDRIYYESFSYVIVWYDFVVVIVDL